MSELLDRQPFCSSKLPANPCRMSVPWMVFAGLVAVHLAAGVGIAVKITPKGENVVPNERAKGCKGSTCNDLENNWLLPPIKTFNTA